MKQTNNGGTMEKTDNKTCDFCGKATINRFCGSACEIVFFMSPDGKDEIEAQNKNENNEYTEEEVVFAEDGEDFQEYVYGNGKRVTAGTPIGYERNDKLYLFKDIFYSSR